jgi:quercetin dioxygenase-like cupin family protein
VEPQFVRLDEVHPLELWPGFTARPLFGENVMLNLVELAPDAVVPEHSHPHEQLGLVVRGLAVMVVEGTEHECGPMDAYSIPGGVPHSARFGPEGAIVLDIFQPVREEYRERWTEGGELG